MESDKNILAVDTSSKNLILGIAYGGDRIVKSSDAVEQSHGQIIIKKISELLQSAGLNKKDINGIIVCTGPGSFTGLRIGIAAAKGIAVALEIPIVSLTIFELAAYKLNNESGCISIVAPLKKDEFFVTSVVDGKLDDKIEIVSDKNLIDKLSEKVAFINCSFKVDVSGTDFVDLSAMVVYDAGDLLYLGIQKLNENEISDINSLEPLYIQKSQAEINYERRNKK